jgi:serine phosphatase RsbU (regulator of sigma subunit)
MPEETILIVDDETANLQKLRRTFINHYRVLSANTGKEALELVRQHDSIAVIVADQRMPDMTGIEFLRETLELQPHAVRIILTGFTDVDVLMDAINSCKVYRYIVKPWDPPDLLMTVERGLEARHLAVENEIFRKELIRRERMARELEIAREIQRYILPSACPTLPGYEMAVEYHPAREVGGDLYDFSLDSNPSRLHVVLGDVSGKSIPAALYGAVFSGQLRTLLPQSMSPSSMLALLNRNLIARYQGSNFIAVAYLQLDLADGNGILANAGMPFPYLLSKGGVSHISIPGVPLALMEGASYDEARIHLDLGDTLILASDGTTDAVDPQGRMFDPKQFLDCILRHTNEDPAALAANLYRDIVGFAGGTEAGDDVTIIAIKRRA